MIVPQQPAKRQVDNNVAKSPRVFLEGEGSGGSSDQKECGSAPPQVMAVCWQLNFLEGWKRTTKPPLCLKNRQVGVQTSFSESTPPRSISLGEYEISREAKASREHVGTNSPKAQKRIYSHRVSKKLMWKWRFHIQDQDLDKSGGCVFPHTDKRRQLEAAMLRILEQGVSVQGTSLWLQSSCSHTFAIRRWAASIVKESQ